MFSTLGYVAKGLNFTIAGDIPQHIGFASSAALETAAMLALKSLYHAQIKLEELPLRLSEAQETFFGFRENIVDYIVMLQARKDTFLVIDEKDLSVRRIKSPFSGYRLFVLDSRVPRAGVEEDLQYLNKELERGLKQLSPGQKKATFRDFVSNDTVESTVTLNEEVRRRCLHVVQELRRVNDAEKALTNADIPAFARIVYHSHESLRDLFEVSCPEIDWMVKRAQETEGVMGSRMTGKGFGGCTYSFIRASASEETGAVPVEEFKKNLEDYERIFGFHPMPYDFSIGSGAKVIAA
jgi:galactokinase